MSAPTLPEVVDVIQDEHAALVGSPAGEAWVAKRVEALYNTYILKLNVPGPDAIVHPLFRAAAIATAVALYKAISAQLDEGEELTPWPAYEIEDTRDDAEGAELPRMDQ